MPMRRNTTDRYCIRNYWNNGYATEAAIGCKEYAFNNKVNSVISLIRPENKASIRVAEKNGMKYNEEIDRCGYLHRVYRINNEKTSRLSNLYSNSGEW